MVNFNAQLKGRKEMKKFDEMDAMEEILEKQIDELKEFLKVVLKDTKGTEITFDSDFFLPDYPEFTQITRTVKVQDTDMLAQYAVDDVFDELYEDGEVFEKQGKLFMRKARPLNRYGFDFGLALRIFKQVSREEIRDFVLYYVCRGIANMQETDGTGMELIYDSFLEKHGRDLVERG